MKDHLVFALDLFGYLLYPLISVAKIFLKLGGDVAKLGLWVLPKPLKLGFHKP